MKSIIEVSNRASKHWSPSLEQCQTWIDVTMTTVGYSKKHSVSLSFVDENASQTLNSDYRGKDKPTNVLSFPAQVPEFVNADLDSISLGDIVICAPVVEAEAAAQEKELSAHWAHLVIHGALHLLGYDHQEETAANEMESIEIKALDTCGFANPYHAN